jgi:hypothetical protein
MNQRNFNGRLSSLLSRESINAPPEEQRRPSRRTGIASSLPSVRSHGGMGSAVLRLLTLALRRPERRLIITRQQIGGIPIDLNTPCLAQPLLGPAAAQ